MISRRLFLRLASGLGAAVGPASSWSVWAHTGGGRQARSPVLRKFVDPLPRLHQARPVGVLEGSPLYDIAARPVRQRLHRDLPPTRLWGYAGHFPGPTLEVRRGQRILVRWRNEIAGPGFLIPQAFDAHLHGTSHGEPATKTVVHVHGALVPPESDGQPDAWFTAGFERRGAEWTQETYAYLAARQA